MVEALALINEAQFLHDIAGSGISHVMTSAELCLVKGVSSEVEHRAGCFSCKALAPLGFCEVISDLEHAVLVVIVDAAGADELSGLLQNEAPVIIRVAVFIGDD